MSLSSITTSWLPASKSIASRCAPLSVSPRMITYGAETVMLFIALFATSIVAEFPGAGV